jgi:hypothetical protein
MLWRKLSFVRMAAAAAVGAGCLAVAACGSGASSNGAAAGNSAAPSPGSTVDPLAGQGATAILELANANAEAAPSLTAVGTLTEKGQTYNIDMGLKRGQGCRLTLGLGGAEIVKLVMIGKAIYYSATAKFYTSLVGANASEASAIVTLIDGRYIEIPTSDKNASSLVGACSISQLVQADKPLGSDSDYIVGSPTTLDGVRVLPITSPDDSIDYVTDTSKPEIAGASAPTGTDYGPAHVTITIGAPVTLTAPPASQVIDGTTLGM